MGIYNKYIMISKPLILFNSQYSTRLRGWVGERDGGRKREILGSIFWPHYQKACFPTAHACLDTGLLHLCNAASNKDGRPVLFLVINWILVGVTILSTLTWRQVLTQMRVKKRATSSVHLFRSVFISSHRFSTDRAVKTIFPASPSPWHLKVNPVPHAASGNHSRAVG